MNAGSTQCFLGFLNNKDDTIKRRPLFSGLLCQDDEALTHETKLCEDKSAGELFRLKAGEDSCRDVIQCTAAVRSIYYFTYGFKFTTIL